MYSSGFIKNLAVTYPIYITCTILLFAHTHTFYKNGIFSIGGPVKICLWIFVSNTLLPLNSLLPTGNEEVQKSGVKHSLLKNLSIHDSYHVISMYCNFLKKKTSKIIFFQLVISQIWYYMYPFVLPQKWFNVSYIQ